MGRTYSFVRVEKIKTYGGLTSKCNHNLRKVEVENADPELAYLNESLLDAETGESSDKNYAKAVKDRVSTLPYYKDHKIRSNQVLAYEVLLTFSRDDSVDIEKWKQLSLKWLHDTFDVAPDGKTNLIDVEYHGDEAGNAHIHAIVCPVDEKGHLNAGRFTGGAKAMSEIQQSYGKCMEPLGMRPGVHRSTATHKAIGRMYATLNNATQIPEVLEGETAEAYRERMMDELETRFAATYRQADDYAAEARRRSDEYANGVRETLHEEMDRERHAASGVRREAEETKAELASLKQEAESAKEELESLIDQMFDIRSEMDRDKGLRERAEKQRKLQEGLEIIEDEDPGRAGEIKRGIDEAVARAEEMERRGRGRKRDEPHPPEL